MRDKLNKSLHKHTFLVVGIYTVISILWILFSDQFVSTLFEGPQLARAQTYKGIFFVLSTAVFLLLLIGNKNRAIKKLFIRLQERMKNFQNTFEQAAVGIAHFSVEEEWLLVNKKLCDMLGYSQQELKSLPFSKLVHPEDLKVGKIKDRKLISGELASYVMEKRYFTKNSSILHGRITKSRVEDKHGNLEYLVAIIENINKEKQAHEKLKESLHQKNLLVREIHHRVKNNLATISGLLELQAYNSKDEKIQRFLRDSMMRIKSMALIHESFYQSKRISYVAFESYLKDFIKHIGVALSDSAKNISLQLDCEPVRLNINQAIPLGLLINELVVNAFLHAFKDQAEGIIQISLTRNKGKIILSIKDNGSGLPPDFSLDDSPSLGTTIVKALILQLNASLQINREDAHFKIVFKREEKRGSSSGLSSKKIF